MGRTVQELTYRLVADEKALVAGLKTAGERTKQLGKQFEATGKTLTKGLTLPIVAAGGAMVKLALDAGNTADRLLDLSEITGLSTDALQELDVVAAEAGVSSEGLARSIQRFSQRLPQLESGTGNSAEALAKLGVNLRDSNGQIRDADDLLPDFIRSLEQVEGTIERNALAQQIFGRSLDDLAPVIGLGADEFDRLRQSARDSGLVIQRDALEAANAFRAEVDQLRVRLQRTRQEIGQQLIPIVQQLIPIFEDAVNTVLRAFTAFTNLDESTQQLLLGIAGIAAVTGPALIAIGKLTAALAFLAANPAVLVAGALIGIATAIGKIKSAQHEKDVDRISKEYGQAAEVIDLTEKRLVRLTERLEQIVDMGAGGIALADAVEDLAEQYGRSVEQVAELALQNSRLTNEQREQLVILRDQERARRGQLETLIQSNARGQEEIARAKFLADQRARAAEAAERERQEAERLLRLDRDRQNLIDELLRIDQLVAAGAIQDIQGLETKIRLREQLIEQILKEARAGDITAQEAARRIADQERNIERYIRALDRRNEAEEETAEQIAIGYWRMTDAQLEAERTLTDNLADERKKQFDDAVAIYNQLAAYVNRIGAQIFANQRAYIENNIEDEEERARQIAILNRKEAVFNKATQAAQSAIDTAAAISKALPNVVLATAVGILGAIQTAAILAQPLPPIPSFSTGGSFTVPPGFDGDSFPLPAAMVQSGERVTVETREQQALADGGGDQRMTVQVIMDGRQVAERTVDYINNGQVRLEVAG